MSDVSDHPTVRYQLNGDDLAHYFQHTMKSAPSVRRRKRFMQRAGVVVLVGLIAYGMIRQEGDLQQKLTAALATVIVFFVMFGLVALTMRIFDPRKTQLNQLLEQAKREQMLTQQQLTLTADGVELKHGDLSDSADWADITRVEKDDRLLYLYVADVSAFIVPLDAFATPDEANRFMLFATVQTKRESA